MARPIHGIDAWQRFTRAKKLLIKAQEQNGRIVLKKVDAAHLEVEIRICFAEYDGVIQLSYFDLYELQMFFGRSRFLSLTLVRVWSAMQMTRVELARISSQESSCGSPESVARRLHDVLIRKGITLVTSTLARLSGKRP